VILVSGIANPERFRGSTEKLGWIVVDHYSFPDHHRFTDKELQSILGRAAGMPVVVTEKDWVKLPAWFNKETDQVAALRIEMVLDDEEAFWAALAWCRAGMNCNFFSFRLCLVMHARGSLRIYPFDRQQWDAVVIKFEACTTGTATVGISFPFREPICK
jgi:hypothetical protein